MPDKPPADTKAVSAAHLAAFGSKDVRHEYSAWRKRMDATDREFNELAIYWRENRNGHPINLERLKPLLDELLPAEANARTSWLNRSLGTWGTRSQTDGGRGVVRHDILRAEQG